MLLALASTVNSIPLPPISDRHGVRLPPQEHCLTSVNFSLVPNPLPDDYDDTEEVPAHTTTTITNAAASQSQGQSTQASALFDSNPSAAAANTQGEDDDYDAEDGDVSMTTVHPTQSQSQAQTQDGVADENKDGGEEEQRGTKRSLDEDEDYD